MPAVVIRLSISPQAYLKHYQGPQCQVSVVSEDGRRVRFPAAILQPFVLHDGIQGRFQIEFDQQGKFSRIRRL